jgi:hypothetical protein
MTLATAFAISIGGAIVIIVLAYPLIAWLIWKFTR